MRRPIKTIVVSGATGALASRLIPALRRRYHVSGIVRSILAASELDIPLIHVSEMDTFFRNERIDAVLHAATCYGRNGESESQVFECNFMFGKTLFLKAADSGVNYFFNIDTSLPLSVSPYSRSKAQFRQWLIKHAGKIQVINLRLEHFYGEGLKANNFVSWIVTSILNTHELKLTHGRQKRDFIHIDDVVKAILTIVNKVALCRRPFESIAIGSGVALPVRYVVERIKQLSESDVSLNFGALPVRPGEPDESAADITRLREFGFRPSIELEEGLRALIDIQKRKHWSC